MECIEHEHAHDSGHGKGELLHGGSGHILWGGNWSALGVPQIPNGHNVPRPRFEAMGGPDQQWSSFRLAAPKTVVEFDPVRHKLSRTGVNQHCARAGFQRGFHVPEARRVKVDRDVRVGQEIVREMDLVVTMVVARSEE